MTHNLFKWWFYTVSAFFAVPGWVLVKCGASRGVIVWIQTMHSIVLRHIVLLPFGIKVRFIGEKPEGASIVAVNHEGWIETVFVFEMSRNIAAWVIKEYLDFPFVGACIRLSAGIEIDTQDLSMAAGKRLLDLTKAALEDERTLFIFPEGDLSVPEKPIPYHPGIYLAYKFNPNVPLRVLVHNGSDCLRRPSKKDVGTKPIPGTIYFVRLEDIPPGLPKKEFMELLECRIRRARQALRGMPSGLSDVEFMQELNHRTQQMGKQEASQQQTANESVAA